MNWLDLRISCVYIRFIVYSTHFNESNIALRCSEHWWFAGTFHGIQRCVDNRNHILYDHSAVLCVAKGTQPKDIAADQSTHSSEEQRQSTSVEHRSPDIEASSVYDCNAKSHNRRRLPTVWWLHSTEHNWRRRNPCVRRVNNTNHTPYQQLLYNSPSTLCCIIK